ncbi:hypothetical protein ACPOL_3619 [Acidisarcina polymorpha]|uniref:Uncharacterized protein n=1 Tax=Acidisarcina polymorpha TaxID=2211140 RepID=A0A2Z5G270_9BACT|nr:hypothetical protein [Acidisarcina polymorpha]AXC12904.1 hypothetical protein ACPOL_3619 [Acidisarcina polymorpha]
MRRVVILSSVLWLGALMSAPVSYGQVAQGSIEHPYRGVQTRVPGVFVTPVPNAPFSAVVDIQTTVELDNGQTAMRKTTNRIARDAQGRIYNERRQLVPVTFAGEPSLLSVHLYDPQTRMSVFLIPSTHLAHEMVLQQRPQEPSHPLSPEIKEEDLGSSVMEAVAVHGILQTKTVTAAVSTTGKPLMIKDQYWYSEDLHLNMLMKHEDPRTGAQIISVTQVKRGEPDPKLFEVPAGYKAVDETPVQ